MENKGYVFIEGKKVAIEGERNFRRDGYCSVLYGSPQRRDESAREQRRNSPLAPHQLGTPVIFGKSQLHALLQIRKLQIAEISQRYGRDGNPFQIQKN